MNRTRAIAIGAFTGVIFLLLIVIVWVEALNSSHTVSVWLMNQDVSAGQQFSSSMVSKAEIKAEPGDFSYTSYDPSSSQLFGHNMKKGDIVRDDDLVPSASVAQIPITPAENVDFSASGRIDVYMLVQNTGQPACVQLIGSQVPVVSNATGSLTIQVPRDQEAAWLTITNASDNRLLVATSGGIPAGGNKVCLPDAITQLVANASSGSTSSSSSPSATP